MDKRFHFVYVTFFAAVNYRPDLSIFRVRIKEKKDFISNNPSAVAYKSLTENYFMKTLSTFLFTVRTLHNFLLKKTYSIPFSQNKFLRFEKTPDLQNLKYEFSEKMAEPT